MDTTGSYLFALHNQQWYAHAKIPHRCRHQEYHRTRQEVIEPTNMKELEQAMIYENADRILVTGHSCIAEAGSIPMKEETFTTAWQIKTEYIGDTTQLADAFQNGRAVAVSDGSYMQVTGAAAWTIKAETSENQIVCTGYTPGVERDQSAYRSELFGLWGILYTVKKFTTDMGITNGAMTIACDGLSALKQAQNPQHTDPSAAHYDLIGAIRWLRDAIPVQITFEHVKGHQDNGQSLALSRTAWMNIKMDTQAKQKAQIPHQGPVQYEIPSEGWVCAIQGQRQPKNLLNALREHINGITIQEHWATKRRYGKGTVNMVDWEATDTAMQSSPMALRRWVSKLAARFLPYGTNMQCWKIRSSAQCP